MADDWEKLPDVPPKKGAWEDLPDVNGSTSDLGVGGAFAHGAVQGGTVGLGDEFQGGVGALNELNAKALRPLGLAPEVGPDENIFGAPSLADAYRAERNAARKEDAGYKSAHPLAYTAGEIAGSMAVPLGRVAKGGNWLLRGLKYAIQGAGLGGASAVGHSESDLTDGTNGLQPYADLLKDAGQGAAIGAPLGVLGGAAGEFAASKGAAAKDAARLAQQKLAEKGFSSARGALGGEVSAGNRSLEVLERAAGDKSLPEDLSRAASDHLATDEMAALKAQLVRSTLGRSEDHLARIRAAREALAEAGVNLSPDAIDAATADRLSLGTAGNAIGSRLKTIAQRFGPAIVGSALGGSAAGGKGAALGAILGTGIGAGLGKPGTIIANALQNPAVVYNASRIAEPLAGGMAKSAIEEGGALAPYLDFLKDKKP